MRNRTRSSFTAEGAAAARAYGAMQKDPKLRCADDLAIRFLGPLFRFALLPGIRGGFLRQYEKRAPGVFFHHIARTKHIDALLSAALDTGAQQLVVLGAGYDSRAHRFASRLEGASVFEVDHPATSAMKQKRAARIAGAAPHARVIYVPVDFTRERVEDRLLSSGYDPARITFFIWEGVTPYLDVAAVDTTLAMVSRAAKGSSVVFDYTSRESIEHPDADAKKQIEVAAKLGEPYTFGVDRGDVEALLARHRLTLEENLSAEALGARYLVGSDGAQWGAVCRFLGVAHGRVS